MKPKKLEAEELNRIASNLNELNFDCDAIRGELRSVYKEILPLRQHLHALEKQQLKLVRKKWSIQEKIIGLQKKQQNHIRAMMWIQAAEDQFSTRELEGLLNDLVGEQLTRRVLAELS